MRIPIIPASYFGMVLGLAGVATLIRGRLTLKWSGI